ncbi:MULTISPECIES: polyphosphate--glucose phosphotransferase [unclassified Microbacterium]|uniref:polyphosphate--glucose phosphotransferase n=1 Tax=unclassified Microbacterium TaxID=2609290 RepID=UPI001AD38912|nr:MULTISPECIES: ROK family protein [unclassified Microbacterium]MBN9155892.1 ROK family protein [Microbacterium sp.]MBS1897792.1 ROK family protein [Actinomycetota bacterium]MBS1899592.1 ROK family protein [Actinomycetota bacterium]
MAKAIGVDIGGTGIKAGVVDLEHGTLESDRIRIPTPKGAKPADVLETVKQVLSTLGVQDSRLPLGVAFPAIVKHGRTLSAANIAKDWIDFEAERFFEDGLGRQITFVNDADAAGVAESRHGAARDARGLTILATLGTGIGSAFLYNGVLVPNTELGHLDFRGESIEKWAAYSAMERDQLDWAEWSARLQDFFSHVEFLFSPDLFVVGGGVSKHPEKFLPLLDLKTPIVAAVHRNSSGIIGAASLAAD